LTAAVERGPSEGARSGSIESSSRPCASPSETARCTSTGDHHSPSSALFQTSTKRSGQGCPLLRASNEHSFIVRVLRARRAPGRSLPILLRPRVARAQKRIRLHPLLCSASRRTTRLPVFPPKLVVALLPAKGCLGLRERYRRSEVSADDFTPITWVAWIGSNVRASNHKCSLQAS